MVAFRLEYTNGQTNYKNSAIYNFESICVHEESFNDTNTEKWVGKHIPILVSASSKLVREPIFLSNSDPHPLVTSSISALENIAPQS